MTVSIVINEQLRVLVGEKMSDIYRQVRILSNREEESVAPNLSTTKKTKIEQYLTS